MSASRSKIQLQETVEAEEIDEEKWTNLKGRSIVLGNAARTSRGYEFMSLLSRRCEHYGKPAIPKWTWFFVDYSMPK